MSIALFNLPKKGPADENYLECLETNSFYYHWRTFSSIFNNNNSIHIWPAIVSAQWVTNCWEDVREMFHRVQCKSRSSGGQ